MECLNTFNHFWNSLFILFYFILFFWVMVSYSQSCRTLNFLYIAKAGLEFLFLLCSFPECWRYRCEPRDRLFFSLLILIPFSFLLSKKGLCVIKRINILKYQVQTNWSCSLLNIYSWYWYSKPIFLKKDLFILSVWMFCSHACLCTTCTPGFLRGQKRTSDSLELELWAVVGCHMGAGNCVLCKNKCS